MICERAPGEVVDAVADGLLDRRLWLRGSVLAKVPLRRRDRFGWPAAILSAVIRGPEIDKGFLAVWALSRGTGPISSLNAVAGEFSQWPFPRGRPGRTGFPAVIMTTYPEVLAAELGALYVDREIALRR